MQFTYDGLGRRISKRYRDLATRWVREGDVLLHEWHKPEVCPAAKLTADGAYSVVADHLGTPLTLYDEQGKRSWNLQLDSYGAVRRGQYEDVETGLYYNCFRSYNPETGQYSSQDPHPTGRRK